VDRKSFQRRGAEEASPLESMGFTKEGLRQGICRRSSKPLAHLETMRRHGPKVMGDDGEFHAVDEVVDLSGTPGRGLGCAGLLLAAGATVFYQFFTRYVLNDSAAWTEEIARYLLIGVVFVGAAIGVAKNNHIQVDFFYRYMPQPVSRGWPRWWMCCASASSAR
jgi:hypothetical protein